MNAIINTNRTNRNNCHCCNKCNRFHPEVILFLRRFAAAGCLYWCIRIGIIIDVAVTLLLGLCIRGSISGISCALVGTTIISSVTITSRCSAAIPICCSISCTRSSAIGFCCMISSGAARCSRCAIRILIGHSGFWLFRLRSCCVVRFIFHHVLFPFIHKNLPFY